MHVFIDESRRREYMVCVVMLRAQQLRPVRALMRSFCMPGQRRIHFVKERRSRRCQILDALADSGVRCRMYVSATADDMAARRECLRQLTFELAKEGVQRLVIEPIEGLELFDTNIVYGAYRDAGAPELVFEHFRAYEEPLLCVADALAWAYGAGDDWRRRVLPMVDAVVRTDL